MVRLVGYGNSLSGEQQAVLTAVQQQDLKKLKSLFEQNNNRKLVSGEQLLLFKDIDGWTILHHCVMSSYSLSIPVLEFVLLTLSQNEDDFLARLINDCNGGKGTALHWAVINGYSGAVELLLNHGADGMVKNSNGLTPLDIAKMKKSNKIIKMLSASSENAVVNQQVEVKDNDEERDNNSRKVKNMQNDPKTDWRIGTSEERESQLLSACVRGDMVTVRKLDSLRVSFLCCDADGNSPLHLASKFGHLDLVKYLIEKGVCRGALNRQGWTALFYACMRGTFDMIQYLVEEAFLDIYVQDNKGKYPFDYCTSPKSLAWIRHNADRVQKLRAKDLTDFCVVCRKPLSLKFETSDENIPECVSEDQPTSVSRNVKFRRFSQNANREFTRPCFNPFEDNISMFQIRFGGYKDLFCCECKLKGSHCRCISEEDPDSLRIRNPHVPFISTKLAILLVLSQNHGKKDDHGTPLRVLRDSKMFDLQVLNIIFNFLERSLPRQG
jgi:ankyrin repeat protein